MKIVINSRCGGFNLSTEAVKWLAERGFQPAVECLGKTIPEVEEFNRTHWAKYDNIPKCNGWLGNLSDQDRANPLVVQCVEELSKEANGDFAGLEIIEIPDNVKWHIESGDDGNEWVAENHRVWP